MTNNPQYQIENAMALLERLTGYGENPTRTLFSRQRAHRDEAQEDDDGLALAGLVLGAIVSAAQGGGRAGSLRSSYISNIYRSIGGRSSARRSSRGQQLSQFANLANRAVRRYL